MTGNRRKSRQVALQVLYQDEFHDGEGLRFAERHFWDDSELAPTKDEIRDFAVFLIEGVRSNRTAIDERISDVARNWKIERMSRVDRNILRVATFELVFVEEVPPKVSLNEAIEIAKVYGTEDSGAFINGVLDRISRDLQGDTSASDEPTA